MADRMDRTGLYCPRCCDTYMVEQHEEQVPVATQRIEVFCRRCARTELIAWQSTMHMLHPADQERVRWLLAHGRLVESRW